MCITSTLYFYISGWGEICKGQASRNASHQSSFHLKLEFGGDTGTKKKKKKKNMAKILN
jgi:hypothetical protein